MYCTPHACDYIFQWLKRRMEDMRVGRIRGQDGVGGRGGEGEESGEGEERREKGEEEEGGEGEGKGKKKKQQDQDGHYKVHVCMYMCEWHTCTTVACMYNCMHNTYMYIHIMASFLTVITNRH